MALIEIKRAEAEMELRKWCADHEYPGEIRYRYSIRSNDVTLVEERPPWDGRGEEWTQLPVARFRFDPDANGWTVSWLRQNRRWAPCDWIGAPARFRDALAEVEADRHATFFG